MALNATIYKVALQISDMDRHYYEEHALILARHPSETDERLMVRVLAFVRHASVSLAIAKGRLGSPVKGQPDEPDLWEKDLSGETGLWIEVGLPDERSIRQACHRAKQVVVYAYGGPKAERWWEQNQTLLKRLKNLTVLKLSPETSQGLAALAQRNLKLHCTIQDAQTWIGDEGATVEVELTVLLQSKA